MDFDKILLQWLRMCWKGGGGGDALQPLPTYNPYTPYGPYVESGQVWKHGQADACGCAVSELHDQNC